MSVNSIAIQWRKWQARARVCVGACACVPPPQSLVMCLVANVQNIEVGHMQHLGSR